MFKVMSAHEMNETFARAFNSRNIDNLLSLYEPAAVLRTDHTNKTRIGRSEIAAELMQLLQMPGTMESQNNFCIEHGDLALLRADYVLWDEEGAVIMFGSSAEIIRRQLNGSWLYVIDHAVGASLPRLPEL